MLVSTPSGVLGSDCTIADAADPITLNLTTGTTDPPPPNTPITGAVGTLTSTDNGLLTDTGMTLVDNAFAVPGAENCGPGGSLDAILDFDKGLPVTGGVECGLLSGSSYTAPAKLIRRHLRRDGSVRAADRGQVASGGRSGELIVQGAVLAEELRPPALDELGRVAVVGVEVGSVVVTQLVPERLGP